MIEQLATIGFKADTRDITRANQELGKLSDQGAKTEKSISSMSGAVSLAGAALAALGAAGLTTTLTKYADTATNLENKLRTVITSTDELTAAQERLLGIANSTRAGLQSTTDLFVTLTRSTTELGLSQERLFRITDIINKSFAVSGASAVSANAAIIQLAQGLGAGALRGDEFNSVAENAPEILRAVAAETGKTTGQLREFAAEGGITAELLIKSLENYGDTVDRVFSKTNATLEQSRTIAANNATKWVSESELIMGATGALGAALVAASENIDAIGAALATAAGVMSLSVVPSIVKMVAGLATATTATGALATATSLLLGPWGLLIAAVGAGAAAFMLTRDAAAETSAALDEQKAILDKLTGEYTKYSGARLASTYAEIVAKENKLLAEKSALEEKIAALASRSDPAAYSVRQIYVKQLAETKEQLKQNGQAMTAVNAAFDAGLPKAESMTDGLKKMGQAAGLSAAELKKLKQEQERLFNEREEHLQDLFDAEQELEDFYTAQENAEYDRIQAFLDGIDQQKEAVTEYASISEKAAERIEEAFADAWLNAFDGMRSVVDGMKNAFKRMLAEMAHMALTKPIMVSLGLGGLLPSGASAATSALGGMSSLSGIGSAIQSLASSTGGMIAIAAGALAGIQKLTGGGLFGTSFKTTGQSLDLMLGGGDVTGSTTTEESRKRSLFRGTKRRTTTSAFDASEIDAAFDSITSALGQAAKAFGIEGADAVIKGFSASVNINIKDKTQEEIQAAIQEWIGSTTDALVNAVFGDSLNGLQKEGEGVIDTVNRLSANMQTVQFITKSLGLDFDLTGKAAMIAATNIVELAGGLDSLAQLSSQYYQAFYSEAERQLMLQNSLTESFKALGVTMPTTREGFRALVDGLDLSTEAGQKLFAELMKLVPGMDQYLAYLERSATSVDDAAEALRGLNDAANAAKSAAQSAFSALERAASAQRDQYRTAAKEREAVIKSDYAIEVARITSLHDARIEQLTAESDAAKAAHDMQMAGLNSQREAAQASLANVRALSDMLRQATGVSLTYSQAQAQLRGMVSSARMGSLPSQGSLSAVLQGLQSGPNASSAADLAFQNAVTANQLKELGGFVDSQLSVEELTLKGIESQIEIAKTQHDETMLLLEKQIEEAKAKFEADKESAKTAYEQALELSDKQLMAEEEALNMLVSEAQKQLNALLGIDDRILSMADALAAFGSAVSTARDAQNAYERSLMEQNAVNAQNNAKVAELLTKIAAESEKQSAAAISTAKHTATTAQVLELEQFERLEASA